MASINEIVKKALFDEYAGGGHNLKTFAMSNEDGDAFAVLIADTPVHEHDAAIIVFARIVGEFVVIEANTTDHPLEDVLVVYGIPREKIICAHWGESLPDTEATS